MTASHAARVAVGDRRTHHVTTTDGVTIGATVRGQGPPLLCLQGSIGDGDMDWSPLTEHLSGRYTCHLPSLRGRGLSGDHPDLRPGRHVEDVLTYLDSIGEGTALVGWSYGAGLALAVAAQSDAVDAVVAFEPVIVSVMDEAEQAVLGEAVGRMGELAAGGRLPDAARAFAGWPFDDGEIAMADDAGYFEAAGRYVTNHLGVLQQVMDAEDHISDAVLGAIVAPTVLLHGSGTRPFFVAGARHAAEQIPDARVLEVPGAGHAAPLTRPEALAGALAEFLARARRPA